MGTPRAGGGQLVLRLLLVWLLLCALLVAFALPRVLAGQFPDPDDPLRLIQVRDLLAGQGWFDLVQHRINPPGGTLMHWSRLVDIPIALVILSLTPLLGQGDAEAVALVAVPLLTLGAIVAVTGCMARRFFDLRTTGFACLCIGLMAPLVFQLQPMRVDHHGWQIFAFVLSVWALSWDDARRGSALAGMAMALGLSISIEALPLAGAMGAILLVRWLADWRARWWLVTYLNALALTLLVAFAATRGLADLAQHCDAISPAHLGFFLIAALGCSALAALPPRAPFRLLLLLLPVGALAAASFALTAPQCLGSPFAGLDPLAHDYWYANVLEGQPAWRQDPAAAIPVMVQLLGALAASLALWRGAKDQARRWWGEYAAMLAAAIGLSLFVWRSTGFAAILAVLPLGWLLGAALDRLRARGSLTIRVGGLVAVILLLVPSLPLSMAKGLATPPEKASGATPGESHCRIRDQAGKLDQFAPATIFAPLDIGPAILLNSHHSVVATGHHRAAAAIGDVVRAFISPPDKARDIIAAHGASYVALCTDLVEAGIYSQANPHGLMALLVAGKPPA